MSEPFLGEIKMFAGNFAPRGFAKCDGQLLAINQNDALFSLLGTIYGGDGRTTFGLPGLRGRTPIHYGSGPGLTPRPIGAKSGQERVFLAAGDLPAHKHALRAENDAANSFGPANNVLANTSTAIYVSGGSTPMEGTSITNTGGGAAHNNMMPWQCICYIIALTGIFPSRN